MPGTERAQTGRDAWARRGLRGPDYTLPLRLQHCSRSPVDRQRLEMRRALWGRALADRCIWAWASGLGMTAALLQVALETPVQHLPGWEIILRLALFAATATGVGVLCGAACRVRMQLERRELSRN